MIDLIQQFFQQAPPAIDPTLVPWMVDLIAGNIIVGTGLWALLKFIAKRTPWAGDDKIIQIVTGAFGAVKDAVGPVKKDIVEPELDLCESCGLPVH